MSSLPASLPAGRKPLRLLGIGLTAGLLAVALAWGGPWWRPDSGPEGLPVLPSMSRVHRLADLPVFPGAVLDPDAQTIDRGPVQTAIYLTDASPDQVRAFYRERLALDDALFRVLPTTWVTDFATPAGEHVTIQAERRSDGDGTRLSLIFVARPTL